MCLSGDLISMEWRGDEYVGDYTLSLMYRIQERKYGGLFSSLIPSTYASLQIFFFNKISGSHILFNI